MQITFKLFIFNKSKQSKTFNNTKQMNTDNQTYNKSH